MEAAPVGSLSDVQLAKVDQTYSRMDALHRACHIGLIDEMRQVREREGLSTRILEIASGSGYNASRLIGAGFQYCAFDLCEPALVVLIRRHPEAMFLNLDIADAGVIADGAFDMVFSASMLEHLEDYASALRHMIRIARRHLFVTFFEGLGDGEDKITRYEYRHELYSYYGRKWADLQRSYGNTYFWNRYSKRTIEGIAAETGAKVEVLTNANRGYITNEAVLHVTK